MAVMNSLPAVPVKHQDFANYVESNQHTPIEELLQPYNDYEAVVRKAFAQEPSHAALRDLRDNHFNLVPLYDTARTNNTKVRARNLDAESPQQKEKYLLPLKDQDRRPNGSPAVVPGLEEFQKNFNLFSEGALSDMDWSNVVVAGSAVVTALMPVPEEHRGSKRALRQFYHEKFAPASDVDLFLYGLSDEQAIKKIGQIEVKIKNTILYETTTVRTKNTITIASQYPTRHVQIVLRIYKSISEILTGFDVDCSCAAYDGEQVYVSPRALASYVTQVNRVDLTRRSPSYENRLSKYSHRGFEVFWPPLDRSRVDPTIFERSFARTVGLARLLVLEKLPKSEDRDRYVMQRRQERGRPLPNTYAQRQRQLPGNIKNEWDDEAPEWQEEDEVSDYHSFSIPYGPRYYAKKIERLLYTKDLLLNAEWNKPKDRNVNLHRHPAFFGDVDYVIHDCCGYCPEPVTQEEKNVANEESKIYISGDVSFIKDDPGRQEIGSFNPVTDTDWTEMAYVGNTERLCQAIVDHDRATVKDWLSQENTDPNTRDYTGRTPLHLASLTSTAEIVQCLVDHGARMISRVADGRTALHFAAARGSVEIVKVLLTNSEQNEEQETKKEDARKGSSEPEQKQTTDEAQDEDGDVELIYADSSSSHTSESYVKVEPKAGEDVFDNLPESENELEPDIYDVDALAWDSHTSPLHLAIINGHTDVVDELVSSFGADVLLPVKLLNDGNSPIAILTLVLALQLPLTKAKAMTQKLLQLGASPAQADMNHNTALHYLGASKFPGLLDVFVHHDEPGVKRAINHLAFAGYSWSMEPYNAFVAAVNAKNVIGAIKLLDAGADASIEFSHFVKSAKAVSDTIRSNSSEENETFFRHRLSQPLLLAINKELPHLAIDLLNRGVNPNTLTPEGNQAEDDEDMRDVVKGTSALDCVREKIKALRAYKGEEFYSSPPRPLEADDSIYLEDFEDDTYAMFSAKQQVKGTRRQYNESLEDHENEVNRVRGLEGVNGKIAAANEMADRFEVLEKVLLEKGAKAFAELHPDFKKQEEEEEEEEEEPKKDRFKVTFSFKVPDLTETKRKGYLKLFNAAWHGDLATIKTLTLTMWGPDNEEPPLQIAVTDRNGFSPFSIAVLRGYLSVAKAVLEIVQAQYKPTEQKGHTRYGMEEAGEDGDEPRIYNEIIDDQYTVENIGEVATQVECPITPLTVFSWDCAAFFFTEQDGEIDSKQRAIQSAIDLVSSSGGIMILGSGSHKEYTPKNLVEYAIWTDNVGLLVFLLDLGQDLTNRNTEAESTIHTPPECVFQLAIILGRLHCLSELIKRTGAGLPIDELAKKSGVASTEKPRFYQGLSIRGKKRADWASAGGWPGRQSSYRSPPLLAAAYYGKLESTKWFLSKEPGQQYLAFTETYEHDGRLKQLKQSAKGVEGSLLNWLSLRNGLVLHCAVMAKPTEESEQLVKYLAEQYPVCLETKSLDGHTPLALAYALHRTSYAKVLVNAGSDQTTRDRKGNNILHLLLSDIQGKAHENPNDIKTLLSLLDSRLISPLLTERSSQEPGSLTPLARWMHNIYQFWAFSPPSGRGKDSGNNKETDDQVAILRLILDFAQSTNQKHLELLDSAGNTPLHDAVKGQLPRALELMVERRPDLLHRESATGTTPFEMAVDAWVNEVTSGPPAIPRKSAQSWSDEEKPEYRNVLDQPPTYFTRDTRDEETRDVQLVICDLCRERSPNAGEKRKLVTLFEANEVAKRLAAYRKVDVVQYWKQGVEIDEVMKWYWRESEGYSCM